MAKLISISLLDEEIDAARLMEALNKLSSRDLRKYFKRKKMAFPRNVRYAFLTKCIKHDFQAVQKEQLNSDNRVFTEFELVEFYKCVENPTLAQEFKKDFWAYFVKATYKTYLTDKNLADLYEIAVNKEETAVESIYGFLVGLNPIFADTEENNLDCLPVETTAQRMKDQFTLFEVREFAKKYGVVVPKYPNAEDIAPAIIEKAESKQLVDEEGLENLKKAEANVLLSFAKENGIYAPRYLKKNEVIDEVISQISSKEIDNTRMNEVFNANLITFKSRSSSDSLCDLLDKYENLDDLSEVRNDNSKDMSPLKRFAVGGAIGLELRYNEESRKARLQERRKKLELLRQQALERKEKFARERREQDLIAQRDAAVSNREEEEARRLAAEERVRELEALLAQQNAEKEEADKARNELETALREEEARRLAAEKALEEAPKVEEVVVETPVEEVEDEEIEEISEDDIVKPEYYEAVVQEEVEVEETREVTFMAFETVEEEAVVPVVEEIPVEVIEEEPVEEVEEAPIEEEIEEELPEEVEEVEEVEETPVEEVEETPVEETPVEEAPVEEAPIEEEPAVEPVKCPVKKLHVAGWIISIVFAALAACLLLVTNAGKEILGSAELSDNANLVLFNIVFIVSGVLAFVVRAIIHKIRCKAKKGIACNKVGEVYKYLWTHLVVTVIAAFAFIQFKVFHFDALATKIGNILDKILANEGLEALDALVGILLMVVVAYLLTLIIKTFVYAIKSRKTNDNNVLKHVVSYGWTFTALLVVSVVAVVVLYPTVATSIIDSAVENVKGALSMTFAPVVVRAAEEMAGNNSKLTETLYLVLAVVVVVYLFGLVGLTIGYSKQTRKSKAQEEVVEETPAVEETPTEEVKEKAPVIEEEPVVVPEEDEEKLLFTTFEEAKLVEDLNDLNRMIGKVNEHVKDLSAIQARLYNELVGEDEIIVEPEIKEQPVVIPEETPTEEVKEEVPVVEEETVEETPVVEEKPKKEKVKKEKIKCSVKNCIRAWLIIAIILVVVAFVIGLGDKVMPVFKADKIVGGRNTAIFVGTMVVAVAIITMLFRLLTHSLRCKAKKGGKCRHGREFLGFLWTGLFFAVVVIALLYVFDWHSFASSIVKSALGTFSRFPGELKIYDYGILGGLLVALIAIIALISGTAKSNKKAKEEKKLAKANENVSEEQNSEETKDENGFEDGVMYFPCMINGKIQMMPISKAAHGVETQTIQPVQQLQQPQIVQQVDPNNPGIQTMPPLQIVQPIQLVQPIESIAMDYDTYVEQQRQLALKQAEQEDEENNVKCPIRRKNKRWFIFTLLLVIAAVVVSMFVEPVKSMVADKINLFTTVRIGKWELADYGILAGTILLVVLILSQWIRFILHPIGCRFKKHKECCKKCEKYKYLWTVVFVGVALVAALVVLEKFGFGQMYDKAVAFIGTIATAKWTLKRGILIGGLAIFALFFIILVFKTFAHKRADRIERKEKKRLEKEAK